MNLLGFLIGGKNSTKASSKKDDNKKAAQRSKVAARGKKSPINNGKSSRRRVKQEVNIINKKENIPSYTKLLSGSKDMLIYFSDELAKDFVIVSVDEEKRQAILFEAVEGRTENRDHAVQLMDCRQKLKNVSYSCTNVLATRDVIRMIHEESINNDDDEIEKRNGELQRHFDALVKDAMDQGSSDIHIEIRRNTAQIRFRKNGILEVYKEIPVGYAMEFAGVIYRVIAEEKDVTFKPGQPQDAVIDRQLTDQVRMRIRLATMPAYPDGVDMVMRLLPIGVATSLKELSELGYTADQVNDIRLATSQPVGVTIISGTTGSGKSTTLVTILGRIIHDKKNTIKVITVEDPPEFELKGATQCPVVRSKKVSGRDQNPFAAAIRAAMRCDPDIILIGETRDRDSCELLIHAVQSGHQCYTTLHAPSAIGIVSRLRSLGAPNDVLGSQDFIAGLIYQTLVPVICKHCRISLKEYESVAKAKGESHYLDYKTVIKRITHACSDFMNSNIHFKGNGCEHCSNGVTGRTVVAEVCVPDHEMISMFAKGREMEAWHHWQESGGSTALQNGIKKMEDGLCDPFDVEHKLGLLSSEIVMKDKVFDYNNERSIFGFENSADNNSVISGHDTINEDGSDTISEAVFSESFLEEDSIEISKAKKQNNQIISISSGETDD